jgi:peptidase M28-like protein
MRPVKIAAAGLLLCLAVGSVFAQQSALSPDLLRVWLSYISSDDLEGRNTFSEGLGLAAAYIADQLKDAGVKPGGDRGSYFQRVPVLGVRTINRSSVTVDVNGMTRTFQNGNGVTFRTNVGGKQTLTLKDVVFVGYGLNLDENHNDYKGLDVNGKAVVWLGTRGPSGTDAQRIGRMLNARASLATDEMGASASIGINAPLRLQAFGARPTAGNQPDFTTTQRLDLPQVPSITADDEFFEFLFSAADIKYGDLKQRGDSQTALPSFTLRGVTMTFNIDAEYAVVNTRYTRNVVGIVEGSDPQLKNTYVAYGAHYDHIGYTQGMLNGGETDRISNGADDDGSGTSTLIGMARAAAMGPKTKRSQIFIWHAGEELGQWGSRYFADYPLVAIENIVAQLNIDMIGRNRDNKESEANTVYPVGADRISTELHNIMVEVNAGLPRPLMLDFELNDPTDTERIYYRSDHYSYAAKGIPVIFFTTGLHPDYHRVTDTADKINYEKMARIGQFVFEIGRRVANLDHAPARDFKGARFGKGASGKISTTN